MSVQKGQKPAGIVNANYPLDQREAQNQAETGLPKGFQIKDIKMPTITLEVKQGGVVGSASPSSGKPLRESISDASPANPEANMRTQFVKEGEFEHSPGAFGV